MGRSGLWAGIPGSVFLCWVTESPWRGPGTVSLDMHRFLFIMVPLLGFAEAAAQDVGTCAPATASAYLDVGNVRALLKNDGGLFWDGSTSVYEVPKGGGIHAAFTGSLWLGGLVEGELRTAASTYGPWEFWAGPIADDGAPPIDCSEYDRIWNLSGSDIRAWEAQGLRSGDLLDWPTGLGAPTLDPNGVAIDLSRVPLSERAARTIDLASGERPYLLGDEVAWWVMNDLGGEHRRTWTPPLGVEVQVTAYAFDMEGAIGNTTFYRYRIEKRSGPPATDVYLGLYLDTDLGNFDDDYIGSDSLLGLGFTYNADNLDEGPKGYGLAPPALGVDFVEAPVADGDGLDNDWDGVVDEEGERLQMSAFGSFYGAGSTDGHPWRGPDVYHYLRGRWKDGQSFTWGGRGRGYSNRPTSFLYSGNPPDAWSELNRGNGTAITPADRLFFSSIGPFHLFPNHPQVFTIAIITSFGADQLDSVRKLKEDSAFIQAIVDNGLLPRQARAREAAPQEIAFAGSVYPTVATDVVTLRYSVPHRMSVGVDVFDVLGRRVSSTPVQQRDAGEHRTRLDVRAWSPGLHFVRFWMDGRVAVRTVVVAR